MVKRLTSSIPGGALEAYDRLIGTQDGLTRKGASMPYTSVNGNMFSFLDATGSLALRLAPAERAAFIERYGTALHVAHGRVMAEYVTVPQAVLADARELQPWFTASYRYVAGLKAKPTRGAG